ncbi:hypothetical protein [Halomonas organivorans]|uniref:KTSC domain-containing protein n=1 Tax=Halomonas organivorans TaxID=257772 RepID=A0A7W5BXZ9_9GAMM|nr:hypothetical protein [Halomonas organivorans]MBB3141194.1 hypothetical protein [Halomonas organivorans]
MQPYLNLGGNSGVRFYEILADRIHVQFKTGTPYTWSYASCGQHHVEQMKTLARNGRGLNSYIMRFVRKGYER